MRSALLAITFVVACGSKKETTPAGPVGQPIDYRSRLSPTIVKIAPTDEAASRHELPVDIHGVKAKLVWRTFEVGPNGYILSAQWEVVTPSRAITLEPIDTRGMMPTNAGTREAVDEQIIVRVRWRDHSSSGAKLGEEGFRITGRGQGQKV